MRVGGCHPFPQIIIISQFIKLFMDQVDKNHPRLIILFIFMSPCAWGELWGGRRWELSSGHRSRKVFYERAWLLWGASFELSTWYQLYKDDFFGDASLGNIFHDKPSTPMFVKNVWKWSDSEDFVLSVIQEGRRLYRWTCSETRGEGWWGQGETFPGSSCLAGPACFMMAWEACRSTTTL